jgi:hypothetical protein
LRRTSLRWFVSLLAVVPLLAGLMRDAAEAIALGNATGNELVQCEFEARHTVCKNPCGTAPRFGC